DLGGILEDIHAVGRAVGMVKAAEELVQSLELKLRQVSEVGVADYRLQPRRRVICIEWLDPLYFAGHWVPQLVHTAGAEDVGARPGAHSTPRAGAGAVGRTP